MEHLHDTSFVIFQLILYWLWNFFFYHPCHRKNFLIIFLWKCYHISPENRKEEYIWLHSIVSLGTFKTFWQSLLTYVVIFITCFIRTYEINVYSEKYTKMYKCKIREIDRRLLIWSTFTLLYLKRCLMMHHLHFFCGITNNPSTPWKG